MQTLRTLSNFLCANLPHRLRCIGQTTRAQKHKLTDDRWLPACPLLQPFQDVIINICRQFEGLVSMLQIAGRFQSFALLTTMMGWATDSMLGPTGEGDTLLYTRPA